MLNSVWGMQNVVLISIPSVMDPKLAPAGKHTLHAYLPATEPYGIWEGVPAIYPFLVTLSSISSHY